MKKSKIFLWVLIVVLLTGCDGVETKVETETDSGLHAVGTEHTYEIEITEAPVAETSGSADANREVDVTEESDDAAPSNEAATAGGEVSSNEAVSAGGAALSGEENTLAEADAYERVSIAVFENLGMDSSLLTGYLYQSGMGNSLDLNYNRMDASDATLGCEFNQWDATLGFYSYVASAEFETEPEQRSYVVQSVISEEYLQEKANGAETMEIPETEWEISFVETDDGVCVRVSGAGDLAGDYFPLEQMVQEPDMFQRYMCRADFYGYTPDELRLIRNEVYAAHGAIFQSEDLRTYFESKPWYQGTVPTAEFPEEWLSNVERANIALLKEMEEADELVIDGGEGSDKRTEFEALPDAPYLPLLDQYRKTGVGVDMRYAKDMGLYYVVPGKIAQPVIITEEQRMALKNGEELEIVVDELSGESMMLRTNPYIAPSSNSYWYYEKGTEPDENSMVANASLDVERGVYTLWCLSDDTIMKAVYEGDIYILKGAVTGAHVSLEWASMDQREIVIPVSEEDLWYAQVGGNCLRHDGRGYFSAIYYLGD